MEPTRLKMSWVIGHEWAVELLGRSIEMRRVSHAYLLTGAAQIGKTTLARQFAQALNCVGRRTQQGQPCGVCRSCRLAQDDKHPDIRVLLPDGDRIKIEAIRELQTSAALAPVEGAFRVYVISPIDAATPAAANCLLKTLEEPPERVILILTANCLDMVLPTIVSRCQVVPMRPLPAARVTAALQQRGLASARADLIGRLTNGRIGWAIEMAQDAHTLDFREHVITRLIELVRENFTARFAYVEQISKKAEQIGDILRIWSSWWHDVLLLALGSNVPLTNIDYAAQLGEWAAHYDASAAARTLRCIDQTVWRLDHNANPRLALEVLMLDLP